MFAPPFHKTVTTMVPIWQQNTAKKKLIEENKVVNERLGIGIYYGMDYGMNSFYKTKGARLIV
jgi:hypothetical protein